MEIEHLERKYLSFKKGVEDALRSFTAGINENVKGMRDDLNKVQQDVTKMKSRTRKCNECKEKCSSKEKLE